MAQLEARLDGIEEVEGSNPFGSTKFPYKSRLFKDRIGVGAVRFKAILSSKDEMSSAEPSDDSQ